MMKKILYFVSTAFILSLYLLGANFVLAENNEAGGNTQEINELNIQIEDRKDKIKEIEDSIERYKKSIEGKRTEALSLKNQMSLLDNYVAKLEADMELTQEKINKVQLEIEALGLSIEDKEKSINKQKNIISEIIQEINISDQKNYLEVMLTNTNFAEFYNQIKYLEDVYTDLGRSVKNLKIVRESLNEKKEESENKKQNFEEMKEELKNKKQDLEEQAGYKERLLVQTKSSENYYQTLVNNLREQYKQIENEISSYEASVRQKLEANDKVPSNSDDLSLIWPTPSHYITSYFHDPDYPYKHVFEHSAIDLRASQGTPLQAASSGYIARAKRCSYSSCYSYILIVHTGDISTLYGHMSRIDVAEGDYVNKGEIIGMSGGTPGTVGAGNFVTGAHLHFEVRKNGIPVNPLNYLSQ